jgi:hypothetical protein
MSIEKNKGNEGCKDGERRPTDPREMNYHTVCSKSFAEMAHRHQQIFDFLFFSISNVSMIDESRKRAAKALAEGGTPEDVARLKKIESEKSGIEFFREKYSIFVSENMTIRLVDNFFSFLSDIIKVCIKSKPELLVSKETISLEEVLKFQNYDDLVSYIVDKKINDLSYGGIKKLEEFLSSRTAIALWQSEEQKALLSISIELRNVHTHNRGIINELTLKRLKDVNNPFRLQSGRHFHANFDNLVLMANNMFDIAMRVDNEAVSKFPIQKREFGSWIESVADSN